MPAFSLFHLVPLFIGTTTGLGGLWPLFDAHGAIREFGLPENIATSPPAQSCFTLSSARITALGAAIWIFYLRGEFVAVDTIMALFGWVGAVDGYICWKEGVPGRGVFRAVASGVVAVWGLLGLTTRL